MAEAKKASFSFKAFRVPNFSYNDSENQEPELILDFNPTGKFNSKSGVFFLTLEFKGFEKGKENNPIIQIKSISEFKFSKPLNSEEIPIYFFSNSIAIVFPYLRAFISNLTLQSNTGVMMLGLMNFTGMGDDLKRNTSFE
ncbi:hypothetical protein ACFO5O_11930 [Geojedonia litorea]|uniref:Preprotein translocase subunit SecB n=1 Tax=Geojedonia litorea TaxID=1268269 RepID=A0ABV9N6V0_9FLAO